MNFGAPVVSSNIVDCSFQPVSGQNKNNTIGIAASLLRRRSWLAQNRDNMSEWSDMSTQDCCFSELAL